jgi:membrane-associated phospholipid phosphatase
MHQKSVLFFLAIWLIGWLTALLFLGNDGLFLFFNQFFSPIPNFWKWITIGGEGWFIASISILIMFWKGWKTGLFLGLGPTLAGLTGQFFKRVVFPDQMRPKMHFESLNQPIQLPQGVEVHLQHSFPSGHTIGAFAFFYLLTGIFPSKYGGLVFLFMAALVGFSRIFLAQHFPVDVLAGSFIGVASAELWRKYFTKNWVVNNP